MDMSSALAIRSNVVSVCKSQHYSGENPIIILVSKLSWTTCWPG